MVNISYYDDEFPLLEGNGLYAAKTSGDGDCLFHSLSDQLYGHENCHHKLRQRVVEHLRTHSSYFKAFIDVAPVRRTPRRRAAASSKADLETHSQDEIDKAFEQRLQRMQKSGVFGDNLEIQAFAREFGVDVKIYQREYAYVICADNGSSNPRKNNEDRKVVHIAYHIWEHYSSIRNRAGPHTGPPKVCLWPVTITAEEIENKLSNSSAVLPWMEEVVAASLPHHETPEKIRETLETFNGNVGAAVSRLLDEWDTASVASVSDSETFANEEGEQKPENLQDAVEGGYESIENPTKAEMKEVPQSQAKQQQQSHIPKQPTKVEQKRLAPEEQQLQIELQQQIKQREMEHQHRIHLHPVEQSQPEQELQQPPIGQQPLLPQFQLEPQIQPRPKIEQQKPLPIELQQEPKPMQEIVFESTNKLFSHPQPQSATVIAEVIEANDEDLSRIKRRKSPDGSPVSTSTISDDASSVTSSVASSFASSALSSSSSESDISITERRRRKPKSQPTPPTRRSQRIMAQAAAAITAPPPPPPPPPPVAKGPPKSRKQQRQAKRKPSATGGRKRKDVGMQTVTVGIRELYV